MQGTNRIVISAAILIAIASAREVFGIEGLKIQVQCPNVILSWPSVTGETYMVQYKPALTNNSTWIILTNSLAASGGSTTSFTHINGAPCPQVSGGGGGGKPSPNPPPAPGSMSSAAVLSAYSASSPTTPLNDQTVLFLANHSVYPPFAWDTEQRPPEPWELEARPPYPWEPGAIDKSAKPQAKPQGGTGSGQGDPGFYQVVRVGVRLFGFTNGMVLSGNVPLPVELGNTDTNGALSQVFLADGNTGDIIQGSSFPVAPLSGPAGNMNGVWNTAYTTNGQYQIQLGALLTDGTVYLDRVVTVTVANRIWFPDPCNIGGHAIYIGAQTVHTNGTWSMDIYDDQNRHVGSLSGSIDGNGYCAYPGVTGPGFSLNNNDASGNQNPSTFYMFVLKAQDQNVPQTGPFDLNTNAAFIEPDWNFTPTKTVTAWWPLFPTTQQGWNDQLSLIETAFAVEDGVHPNLLGVSTFPFQVQDLGGWAQVLNAFKNTACRDFIYFGHGAPNGMGQGGGFITTANVQTILQNNQANPLVATNRHPFRFVFMDGCDTAEGIWPQTFGIPKQKGMHVLDFVNKRGIRPRAFMGWDRTKFTHNGIIAGAQLYPPHYDYISQFWSSWSSPNPTTGLPETVSDAIAAAAIKAPLASLGMQLYGAVDLVLQY